MNYKKTIIKNMFRVEKIHDYYHKINIAGQFIRTRRRTGQNRLNTHMNRKMKLAHQCVLVIIEDQITEHNRPTTEISESHY